MRPSSNSGLAVANEHYRSERVYSARTLEEVRLIEAKHEAKGLRYALARALIVISRRFANAALTVCRILLFGLPTKRTEPWRNIVGYTVGTLGDNSVMVPALAALKQAFPSSSLTVMNYATGDNTRFASELFSACPWIDRVIPLPDAPVEREGLRLRLTYKGMAEADCDLFVNLSPFCNTGWLGAVVRELIFAKSLGARRAVGFRINSYNRPGDVLNKVKHHFVQNEPTRARQVLKELGLVPESNPSLFAINDRARQEITKLLGPLAGRPVFVINPGAKFPIKRWPSGRFGQLAVKLVQDYGAAIAVTGLRAEKDIGEAVISHVPDDGVNLCGKTSVIELLELLRLSTACVTNDTGTMHLAAALGVPTVALFSTRISPSHWFPLGPRVMALFSFSADSYSYKDDGDSACPCLLRIGIDHVMNALKETMRPIDSPLSIRAASAKC